MQVKLLRVLQEGEFERVGGTKTIKVNVRLIAATNKTLLDEVRQQKFREDLYYRINVIYLKVPTLRERKEDIAPLIDVFIRQYATLNAKKVRGISKDALEALVRYDWPGNIRELKNIMERMIVLSSGEMLTMDQIPEDLRSEKDLETSGHPGIESMTRISDAEKEMIRKALIENKGNKSVAAAKLGISRRTLYRKLEEYKLA
jgi:transcriptional regulator with PAS, ATPase and Fis domain